MTILGADLFLRAWEPAKGQIETAKVGLRESYFHYAPGGPAHQLMHEEKAHQFLNVTEQKRSVHNAWLWNE